MPQCPKAGRLALYPEIEPYDHGLLDVANGNLVYWEICGNPRGKPAVVLHGGPGSGCTAWHRRLFDPGAYRIVLFDQRNCGRSTPHASDPAVNLANNTTARLIEDIDQVRENLGLDRWLVLGGSWGCTSKRNPRTSHERAQAPITPMTMPSSMVSRAVPRTDLRIVEGKAPKAIRIPISCVRWLTT